MFEYLEDGPVVIDAEHSDLETLFLDRPDSGPWEIKPNCDCNYTFSIDLATDGNSFSAKPIGIVYLQSKFGLI